MNINVKHFKFSTIRDMIEKNDLKYNLTDKNFDLFKHNLGALPFGKVIGIDIPTMYAIEYEDGRFEIISNSVFIDLFLNCNNHLNNKEDLKQKTIEKIDSLSFRICIFNITKNEKELKSMELKFLQDFKMHAEAFNFDDMYLKSEEIEIPV